MTERTGRGKRNQNRQPTERGSVLAALRGFGNTATLGLDRYPAALLMAGIDKAVGDGSLTYRQALAEIRDLERADKQDFAGSRLAGQIGGGLVNAVMTGGAGIVSSIGRGAAQGATAGFTANEGMEGALRDTLTGGTIGGALSGAGGALGKGQEVLTRRFYTARNTRKLDEALARAEPELDRLQSAFQQAVLQGKVPNTRQGQIDFARSVAASNSRMGRQAPEVVEAAKRAAGNIQAATNYNKGIERISAAQGQEALNLGRRALRDEGISAVKDAMGVLRASVPMASGGYALGAGYGLLGGGDWQTSAHQGALMLGGAGLAGRLGQLKFEGAKNLAAYVPYGTGETLGRAATLVAAPAVVGAREARFDGPEELPADWFDAGPEELPADWFER